MTYCCLECGNYTDLHIVALPVCATCYKAHHAETREEHYEHIAEENARLEHPAGKGPRRRAQERWFPAEFLGRSGE